MNEKRNQEYQSMDPEYVTGQINSCILELLLSVLISYSFCSPISVSKKWNIETMLTFRYSCNWQKLAKAKWMKKEAMSIRVWTLNMQLGKLIVVFWSYFWDNFVVFAFLLSTSIDPASSGSYKNFPTINKCFWLTSIQGLIWKQRATLGLKLDWNISSVVLVLPSTIIA